MKKLQSGKDSETTAIVKAAKDVLLKNRRTVAGHTFTVPSPYEYRHQWLWDSCFHAIVLRHFEPELAEAELISLLASQHRNGMVPHESKHTIFGIPVPYTSRITQPPFIARAALDVYSVSKNRAFLQETFPGLQRYYAWLAEEREINGVINVVNPLESGEDNSISSDNKVPFLLRKTYGFLAGHLPLPNFTGQRSVTVTAVYADALESMAEIAEILSHQQLAAGYRAKGKEIMKAMQTFRQPDGLYYNLASIGEPIPYKSHGIFVPLFAGLLEKEDAENLINEHLLNKKEFWTLLPVPTVGVNEPKFSPTNYWRGPTWMNINWMICRGLRRYGYDSVADEVTQKSLNAVRNQGFRQYYNPLTGEGLGARSYGWSTLIVDMAKQKK